MAVFYTIPVYCFAVFLDDILVSYFVSLRASRKHAHVRAQTSTSFAALCAWTHGLRIRTLRTSLRCRTGLIPTCRLCLTCGSAVPSRARWLPLRLGCAHFFHNSLPPLSRRHAACTLTCTANRCRFSTSLPHGPSPLPTPHLTFTYTTAPHHCTTCTSLHLPTASASLLRLSASPATPLPLPPFHSFITENVSS